MKTLFYAIVATCLYIVSWPAMSESLRCTQGSVYEGDSRASVLFKCGQPAIKDTFCDPVYFPGNLHPVPQPFAQSVFPCLPVELWVYDRGQGNLFATLRFRGGSVQSISYGQQPG